MRQWAHSQKKGHYQFCSSQNHFAVILECMLFCRDIFVPNLFCDDIFLGMRPAAIRIIPMFNIWKTM